MELKVLMTTAGAVLGEVDESIDGRIQLKNPYFLQVSAEGIQAMPIVTPYAKDDTVTFNPSQLLIEEALTPRDEWVELYKSHHSPIVTQSKKLVLPKGM